MSKTKLLLFLLFIAASVNAQWYKQPTAISPSVALTSVHCADANTCVVVGPDNIIFKTIDGSNWTYQISGVATDKLVVKMYNKDTIVLGQTNATIKRTTNVGGTNWSNPILVVTSASTQDVNDISFISKTNFVVVGGDPANHLTGGRFTSKTTNSGANWTEVGSGSGLPTFFGVHAFNTNTFVACGGAGSIYKTVNGGTAWTQKTITPALPATTTLYDIHFPTPLIGYAVGGNSSNPALGGTVYKTTNAGETWAIATGTLTATNALYGVHFVNKDTGYVVGSGGKIQVTQNGGTNWTAQISPVTTTLNKIHFPTKSVGYISGVNGVILKTITGGFIAPAVVSAGADKSICKGACVTLKGSPTASGGTTPYTYSWSPVTGTKASLVVCPTITTTYTVTVTDANNTTASDAVKVTVHIDSVASFTGLDSVYCNMITADSLTGSPMGGTFSSAGIAPGDSVFNAFMAGAGTQTVTYTYTTSAGCVFSASDTTKVLPLTNPVQLCLVTVDSNMVNTSNIVTWVKPAATNIDSFRVYRMTPPASTFTLIAAVSYTADSKYVDSSVDADPNAIAHKYAITVVDTCGFESAKSDTNTTMWLNWKPVYNGINNFTLNWTPYDGFAFSNYEIWRTIDGGANWVYVSTTSYFAPKTFTDQNVPSLGARYRIRATRSGVCPTGTDTFSYSLSNVTNDYTAVNEISLNTLLHVYPNPSHGTFNVELSGTGYEVKGLKVYNMLGAVIYQSAEPFDKLRVTTQISIPGITPGVYQLQVITDSGTANKKITIE